MGRYRVDNMAFSTGEWYKQTETDSKAAAFSVATLGNFGRAVRLTDTATGEVLMETPEDPDMKKTNGY